MTIEVAIQYPQRELSEFYRQIREQPWPLEAGLPAMIIKNMSAEPLLFQSGTCNPGLELLDVYTYPCWFRSDFALYLGATGHALRELLMMANSS